MVQWLAPSALSQLEAMAGDVAWRTGATQRPERRVVVVDIDEASLRANGPWPWPRTAMADLAERLARAGAAVQVYDIGFPDPRPGDAALAAAWSRRPVVLGQLFSLDTTVTPEAGTIAGRLAASGCPEFAPKGHGAYGTAAELLTVRPAVGHMTPRIEGDGVVRQLPALICHRGAAYSSLSLAALWRLAQPDQDTEAASADPALAPDWQWHVAAEQGVGTSPLAPAAWLSSPSFPGLVVPLDERGNLRVPYRVDRKAIASISAAKVLAGDTDTALLKGAVVVVGATAFGVGDVVATPHAAVAAGLEVHVQTLVGLLDRRIPYEPRMARLLQVLAGVALAGILLLVAVRPGGRNAQRLPAVGLALALLVWLASSASLLGADLWLPWAPVALFVLAAAGALAIVEHGITLLQRERLSAHLGAYLPRPVAQRLMSSDPTGRIQVEERDVSVLVADIRNFSAFAAHRPAEETVALLHAFSSIAVDVVERHGGVVERVAGDSILAVWNAFSQCEAHPEQAMAAARELLSATRTLLTSNRLETDGGLVQPLALGIGLESGTAIVGSFGPARRRAHAALGEPVSIASRLQEMTIDLSVPILAGPRLAAALRADSTESLGEYLLEGLGRHCRIYAPAGWAELVPVDPGWATAATAGERQSESRAWTRWNHSGLMSAVAAGRSSSRSRFGPRNA
ncbi:CHASE2 domain-containing protein [Pseudaquabacterium terrae]|nr:adenylate/guanylate cyclase domain-containing protein [Aquabacterium terrae]